MKKVLTFYLGQTLFAIELDLVKEITRNIEYTPVLGAKKYIKGLMNLRGNIITIFDLSTIVGEDCIEENTRTKCVVLKARFQDSDEIGFLVDKTGEVIDVKNEDFFELPENMGVFKSKYISSVINLEKELLRILDLKKIYDIEKVEGIAK